MSRLLAGSLSVAVLIGFAAQVRAADDDPKEIVAKAIKAHGGEEFLTKYKASQMKLKGKIDIPGVGEVDFTQEAAFMLPDKFRESVEFKIGGTNVAVRTFANGDKLSIEANGQEIPVTDQVKDSLKDAGHILLVARLVPLKEKSYELSLIGDDKVGEKKVVGVRVAKKGQKDVSLYFDKETWLLAKMEYRGAVMGTENEVNQERIIKEYEKNKDGIPVAKKILIKYDGKQFLEAEVTEIKYFEKLDDSEFKK